MIAPFVTLLQRWVLAIVIWVSFFCITDSAIAASSDPYVTRYLDVVDAVSLPLDSQGNTQMFSAEALSEGKQLFEENCKNCHVGGATLPDPTVSLSLDALKNATPPRDTVQAIAAFLRLPMTYDGQEETFWCRQVPESWMDEDEITNLAAFVLRAAQKAPGWGTNRF